MFASVYFGLVQEGDNYGDNSQKSWTLILWYSPLPKPSLQTVFSREELLVSTLSRFLTSWLAFKPVSLPPSLDTSDTFLIRLIVSTQQ